MSCRARRCLWLSISMLVALAISAGSLAASARRWARAMKAGRAAYEQADFATAEKQFKVAFTAATKFELGDPRAVRTLNAIGNLYRAEDKTDAAEAFLSKARAMAEAWLGAESPELATALNNLGGLYTSEQRFAKAEEVLRPALAMREKLLGPEHPALAATQDDLAVLYTAEGRYAEAEPLERSALEIFEHTLRPDHPYVAAALQHYATLLRKLHRQAEADTLEARAFTIAAGRSQSKGGDP